MGTVLVGVEVMAGTEWNRVGLLMGGFELPLLALRGTAPPLQRVGTSAVGSDRSIPSLGAALMTTLSFVLRDHRLRR